MRDILRNPLYIGRAVFNRTQQVWIDGRRTVRKRPRIEWVERSAPELAIVPLDLWQRVQSIVAADGALYKRAFAGRLGGRRAGTRITTPYLLSGIAQCGVCESSIMAAQRNRRRGKRAAHYRCYAAATRGPAICPHDRWLPMVELDRLVLDAISEQVMNADLIQDYITEALVRWNADRPVVESRRAQLTRELRTVERDIAKLERRLLDDAPWQLVAEPLTARRQRRDTLRAELAQAEAHVERAADLTAPALRRRFAAKLADWKTVAAGHPGEARRVLMALLAGERIVVRPLQRGSGCVVTGRVSPQGLLGGEIGRTPQGHHIRHWAHGGPTTLSNLALLCRRHHRAVHEEGYQIERQPGGALQFRRPDGRIIPDVPPPSTVPADPVATMRARHEQNGLALHPWTAIPDWRGEPLDLGYAIDVLHPRARRRQV